MLQPSAVVELIWQDASGSTATTTVFAPSSLTVAEIEASAAALASLVAPLTDCVLVGQRIRYRSSIEVLAPASGSNLITHMGVLFFSMDGGDTAGAVLIPAVKDAAFIAVGPGAGAVIDLGNADVSSLVTAVLDSGICNPFAVPFADVVAGYLQSRV